jgi:uncharacterized protein
MRRYPSIFRAALLLAGAALLHTASHLDAQQPTPALPAEAHVVGTWQGQLEVPGGLTLAIVFHIALDEGGALAATADSPDQGASGLPVAGVTFEEGRLTLEMPTVGASFRGELVGPDQIEGTFLQGGAEMPLVLERVDEVQRRPRPQDPEPPFPYQVEEVRYPNPEADIQLAGTLTLPEGAGPFPAVALITGSGAQNRDLELMGHRPFLVLADHLTRQGIAVLRSDDRGVGESEGDFGRATSRDFAGDAAAAVAYLRERPDVDPSAVGLVGLSEGGLIAPMVATEWDGVAFIVLLAGPGLTGEEILYLQSDLIGRAVGMSDEHLAWNRELQRELFRVVREVEDEEARKARLAETLRDRLGGLAPEARAQLGVPEGGEEGWIEGQLNMMGGPWFRYFLIHDPAPVLRRVEAPVLALNGELDLQVPPEPNLAAIEAALLEGGNPDFTVHELPGLNHLFQSATTGAPDEYARIEETMSPVAMEMVADWILSRVPTAVGSPGER